MTKVTKSAHLVPSLLWERKIGSITCSHLYLCLYLVRNLHINVKNGVTVLVLSRKTQNGQKNCCFCTVARYLFTEVQQCNSVIAITHYDRCVHCTWTKMLSTGEHTCRLTRYTDCLDVRGWCPNHLKYTPLTSIHDTELLYL